MRLLLALAVLLSGTARSADIVVHSVLFEPIGAAMMRAFNAIVCGNCYSKTSRTLGHVLGFNSPS